MATHPSERCLSKLRKREGEICLFCHFTVNAVISLPTDFRAYFPLLYSGENYDS